jgi:hypothetical protein
MDGNVVVPATVVAYDSLACSLCRKSRFIGLLLDPSVEAQPAKRQDRFPDFVRAPLLQEFLRAARYD